MIMILLHQCFTEINSTTCLKGGGRSSGIRVTQLPNPAILVIAQYVYLKLAKRQVV